MSAVAEKPLTIRKARDAAGLTQEKLARAAGVSLAYVRMIEGGYEPAKPSASPKFERVLAALDPSQTTNGAPAESAAVQKSVRQDRHGAE